MSLLPSGRGVGVVLLLVVMEVFITVNQLHDQISCTSPPLALQFLPQFVGALDCWNTLYDCAVKQ